MLECERCKRKLNEVKTYLLRLQEVKNYDGITAISVIQICKECKEIYIKTLKQVRI